jgi:hypothetical protein
VKKMAVSQRGRCVISRPSTSSLWSWRSQARLVMHGTSPLEGGRGSALTFRSDADGFCAKVAEAAKGKVGRVDKCSTRIGLSEINEQRRRWVDGGDSVRSRWAQGEFKNRGVSFREVFDLVGPFFPSFFKLPVKLPPVLSSCTRPAFALFLCIAESPPRRRLRCPSQCPRREFLGGSNGWPGQWPPHITGP